MRAPVHSPSADLPEVLLVYPPTGWEAPESVLPPLSLIMLVRPLERAGFRATLLDARVEERWREHLAERARIDDVIAVGISSMTGPQIRGGLEAAEIVRRSAPTLPIVWGGVHVSLLPDSALGHPLVDAIVMGEGDQALPRVAAALVAGDVLAGIPGVGVVDDAGRKQVTPEAPRTPLDELELPAYDAVDGRRYRAELFGSPTRSLPIVTSRGCPYSCTYCYNRVFDGRRWRPMSPARLLEVLAEIRARHDVRDFFLLDDEFFIDHARVRDILERVLAIESPYRFHNANCRVGEILRFEERDLHRLHAAGFRQIFVGVESGSDTVLEHMVKEHTVADVLEANRKLARTQLTPAYSFMAGLPFETVGQVRETLSLMERLVRDNPRARILNLSLYSPFPGTPLFKTCIEMGYEPPERLEDWTSIRYDRASFPGFDAADQRFLEDAHYFTAFLDGKSFLVFARGRRFRGLRALFSRILRLRVRLGWYRPMPILTIRRGLRRWLRAEPHPAPA